MNKERYRKWKEIEKWKSLSDDKKLEEQKNNSTILRLSHTIKSVISGLFSCECSEEEEDKRERERGKGGWIRKKREWERY